MGRNRVSPREIKTSSVDFNVGNHLAVNNEGLLMIVLGVESL